MGDPRALSQQSPQHEPDGGTPGQQSVSLCNRPHTHGSQEGHLGRMPPFPSEATCLGLVPLEPIPSLCNLTREEVDAAERHSRAWPYL